MTSNANNTVAIIVTVKRAAERARVNTQHNLLEASKNALKRKGLALARIGAENEKTLVPGTYRSVDESCPECPYKGKGCYANGGNVGIHQRASSGLDTQAHVDTATLALAVAAAGKTRARLHVAGDFGLPDGSLDVAYIEGVIDAAQKVREAFGSQDMIGWSYTHFPESVFKPYEARLREVGIGVRYSDKVGKNGAIIRKFDTIQKGERAPDGSMLIKCPAQLRADFACKDCKLCANGNGVVVFDPHGAQAKAVEVASPALAATKAAIDAVKAELVEVA